MLIFAMESIGNFHPFMESHGFYQWRTVKKSPWLPACTSTSQVVVFAHGLGLVLRLEDTGVSFQARYTYIQIIYIYMCVYMYIYIYMSSVPTPLAMVMVPLPPVVWCGCGAVPFPPCGVVGGVWWGGCGVVRGGVVYV